MFGCPVGQVLGLALEDALGALVEDLETGWAGILILNLGEGTHLEERGGAAVQEVLLLGRSVC